MNKLKHFLVCDFETFYTKEYSLKHLSVPQYILDARFAVQMLAAYDLRWDAPRIINTSDIPTFLRDYPAEQTICVSHNALFDMAILAWRYGYVPGRMVDTLGMVRALRNYRRNSLKEVIKELFGRDSKGDTLHKVIGLTIADIRARGMWGEFCTYAMNDARECMNIYLKLAPEFPLEERVLMDLVLRAAIVPVLHADVPMLEKHLLELRQRKAVLLHECGYDKAALMSTALFQQALEREGVEIKTKESKATGKPVPQFAKSDPFMAELLEYDQGDEETNYRVQALAAARLSERSTIEETRTQRFIDVARLPWRASGHAAPLLPVALRYGGAHTHRLCLVGETQICILRDCQVLTIRLDQLQSSDLVWDGELFVRHGGLAFAGIKEVIEYNGIVGTPDHRVWTVEHGYRSLAEAKARGYDIARGNVPDAARIDPTVYRSDSVQDQNTLHLQPLWQGDAVNVEGFAGPRQAVLSVMPQAPCDLEFAGLGLCTASVSSGAASLYEQEDCQLQGLRRARDNVSVLVGQSHDGVGLGEFGATTGREVDRPDRQQRSLRTRQPALGDTARAKYQQTWDIVDCGPRNRFMANGKIVHNSGEWRMNLQNLPRDKEKSRLRAALLAPPGYKIITADLAQIECRILARVVRQDGLTVAFTAGEDVYASFASMVFRCTVTKKTHPSERFVGKTAILGLGYGCGHERFYQMVLTQARQAGIQLAEFDLSMAERIVHIYRTLFGQIVKSWKELDRILKFVLNSDVERRTLWGPVIAIPQAILLPNHMALRYSKEDLNNLYGAKLLENIVQALARIVIFQAALQIYRRGYRFVLSAHDELVYVVPECEVEQAKAIILEEMTREPVWLPGLPLAAEVGVGDNYASTK